MIVEAVFAYRAEVTAQRQRTPRPKVLSGRVPVEIREAASADAPVAFRWKDGERERHARWDGERLFEPVREGADAAALLACLDHRTLREGGPLGDVLGLRQRGERDREARFPEDDPTVARIVRSDVEARAEAVRQAASEHLLIDGILHREGPEPVYVISNYASIFEPRRWVMSLDVMRDPAGCGFRHYRADEREAAIASHELADGWEVPRIEVLLPEACRAPMPEASLLSVASDVLDAMKREALDREVGFFATYAKVRDDAAALRAAVAGGLRNEDVAFHGSRLSIALSQAVPDLETLEVDAAWTIDRVRQSVSRHETRLDLADLADIAP